MGVSVSDPELMIYEMKEFDANLNPACDLCSLKRKRSGPQTLEPLRGTNLRFYLTLNNNILWGDGESYEIRIIDQSCCIELICVRGIILG